MKNLILAALLVSGTFAQAEVVCSISGANPKEKDTYDQPILNPKKIEGNDNVVIVKDGKVLEADLSKFTTLPQWQSVNGAYLVGFAKSDTGMLSLVVTRINTRDLSNMSKMVAAAAGGKDLISLAVPSAKFSASCLSY